MSKKRYESEDTKPMAACDPVAAYGKTPSETLSSDDGWNPNVPFHGTQEEWWEHFHRIEEGEFMPADEYKQKFNAWKKEYLESLMK